MVFDVEGSDTHNAWLGIVEIWRKSWWERAWILQESTVPENVSNFYLGVGPWHIRAFTPSFKVVFLCGQYSTHWMAIHASIMIADHLQTIPLLNTTFLAGASDTARKVFLLKHQRWYPGHPELLELLQRFRHAKCSDPRDKVYSLLGLVKDPVKLQIVPEYKKPVIDVYKDSIRHCLNQQRPNLDFLGYAMKLDSPSRAISDEICHATWPSWIPNWDDPIPLQPLPKILYSEREKPRRTLLILESPRPQVTERTAVGKVYDASLDFTVDASVSNHRLDVEGVRADIIADLWSYESMSSVEGGAKLNEWKSLLGGKYGADESFDEALARVQVADVQYTKEGYAIARNNAVDNLLLLKPTAELTLEEARAKANMRVAFLSTKSLRGLCLTRKGYLAMVPSSAKIGDCICVLLGGQVTYVLRDVTGARQGNMCEYIGECYTHGLMDGEVMRWVRDGRPGFAIEQFTLV
ncbi:hypothetical protein H2200_012320 [Cladophialophora chaetospira]|uniref:Heterokaryon incompatibility domain-containing protein n=1 Tax=Cladophialophora chaetospira TaxID=386627 RepID=A0AA38WXM1_9EURO|nr:hypothetical protein H2200_012320 [Cladophialophora chaetospira]